MVVKTKDVTFKNANNLIKTFYHLYYIIEQEINNNWTDIQASEQLLINVMEP